MAIAARIDWDPTVLAGADPRASIVEQVLRLATLEPIGELIERSSLGTPAAKAARARVPDDVAQAILARVPEMPDVRQDDVLPPCAVCWLPIDPTEPHVVLVEQNERHDLTPHSRSEYLACLDVDADPLDDELETARRVWVRLSQGRGGTQRRTGWRNYQVPRGSSIGMPGYLEAYVRRMAPVAERLARVSLECRPALEIVEAYGRTADGVVLYVDPPYLGSTRSGRNYLVEMSSETEHLELLAALNTCRAHVLLSGYDSPIYAEHLGEWERRTWQTTTNAPDGNRAERTEVLWSNRPLDVEPGLWDTP
jgi:DNA adenine methylase